MSDAHIEAHGRKEHDGKPQWSCPCCLLDWSALVHRDLNIALFDREALAAVKKREADRHPHRSPMWWGAQR